MLSLVLRIVVSVVISLFLTMLVLSILPPALFVFFSMLCPIMVFIFSDKLLGTNKT